MEENTEWSNVLEKVENKINIDIKLYLKIKGILKDFPQKIIIMAN